MDISTGTSEAVYVSLNADGSLLTVGLRRGFSVNDTDPLAMKYRRGMTIYFP